MSLKRIHIKALRISIWEGALAALVGNLTGNFVVLALLKALKAEPLAYTIIYGSAYFSGLIALYTGLIIQKYDIRKQLCIGSLIIARFLVILVPLCLLLPNKPVPGIEDWWDLNQRLSAILIISLFANLVGTIATNAWQSWIGDLVPEHIRGSYFSMRNTILSLLGTVMATIIAYAIDYTDKIDSTGNTKLQLLQWCFIVSAIPSIFNIWLLSQQPVHKMRIHKEMNWSQFIAPIKDRTFRFLFVYLVCWSIATGVAEGMFGLLWYDRMGIDMKELAYMSWVAQLGLITLPLWGFMADKYGQKRILIWATLGVFWQPLLSVWAQPGFIFPIYLDAFLSGLFWPAVAVTQTNLIYAHSRSEERGSYFAYQAAFTGLVRFGAMMLGGAIAQYALKVNHNNPHIADLWDLKIFDAHLPIVLSFVLRTLCIALVFGLAEAKLEHSKPPSARATFKEMMRILGTYNTLKALQRMLLTDRSGNVPFKV